MKTSFRRLVALLLFISSGLIPGSAHALSVSDLAGTWRVVMFSTPSQVTVSKDGNNRITGINQGSQFEYGSGRVTFVANGALTGTFSGDGEGAESLTGTVAVTGQGKVTVSIDGDEGGPIVAHINAGLDFMISFQSGGDVHDALFFLKEPAAVNANDLAGNWVGFGFEVPSEIKSLPAGSPATSVTGLNKFGTFPADLTVSGGGTFSGSLDGPFTGSYASYSGGALNLNIVPQGEDPFVQTVFINASKTIMMQIIHHDDFLSNELLVFMRQPSTAPDSGDTVGHWNIGFLSTPAVMTTVMTSGFVTELNGRFDFETATEKLTVGTDEFFTAQFEDGPETGSITSVSSTGEVSLFFIQNSETASLQMNATGDIMATFMSESSHNEFIFAVKSPPSSTNTEETGLVAFKTGAFLNLFWAAGPGRYLEQSSDLMTWTVVSGTAGEHGYDASVTGKKFYRVATTPD